MRNRSSFAIHANNYQQEMAFPADVLLAIQDVFRRARAGEPKSFPGVAAVFTQELRMHLVATSELLFHVARSWLGTDTGRYPTPILLVQLFNLALFALGGRQTWTRVGLLSLPIPGTFGKLGAAVKDPNAG